jgi:hypothetical protein
VGLERGPLSFVSTTEELLGRNSSGFGLEIREYSRGDPLRWPRDTLYPQKLALTSTTRGGLSVGIVRSRTKATELNVLFSFVNGALGGKLFYRFVSHPNWFRHGVNYVRNTRINILMTANLYNTIFNNYHTDCK